MTGPKRKGKYSDFCVDPASFLSRPEYLFELKFLIVRADSGRLGGSSIPEPQSSKPFLRGKGNGHFGRFLKEVRRRSGLEASYHGGKIIRPVPGFIPEPGNWIELTPSMIKAGFDNSLHFRWMTELVSRCKRRFVVSTDCPRPPAFRDTIAAISSLLSIEFAETERLIVTNSNTLIQELTQ